MITVHLKHGLTAGTSRCFRQKVNKLGPGFTKKQKVASLMIQVSIPIMCYGGKSLWWLTTGK